MREMVLSEELEVACAIYVCERRNEKIWFAKIAELLEGKMSHSATMKSLRTLIDFGIVKAQYGKIGTDRAGRLLYISGESKQIIEQICGQFLEA